MKTNNCFLIVAILIGTCFFHLLHAEAEAVECWTVTDTAPMDAGYEANKFRVTDIPRPHKDDETVPTSTCFFIEVTGVEELPDGFSIYLTTAQGVRIDIFSDSAFIAPYNSDNSFHAKKQYINTHIIYAELSDALLSPLENSTVYTLHVTGGVNDDGDQCQENWNFTTIEPKDVSPVNLSFNLSSESEALVEWHGGLFNGFQKPNFNSTFACNNEDGFDLMSNVRDGVVDDYWIGRPSPKAFSIQLDDEIMANDANRIKNFYHGNIIRDSATRHIKKGGITTNTDSLTLEVENVYGYEQYLDPEEGFPMNLDPYIDNLTNYYSVGDVVLIANGSNTTRAVVRSVDDINNKIVISKTYDPTDPESPYLYQDLEEGLNIYVEGRVWDASDIDEWLNYDSSSLSVDNDTRAPGLFPPPTPYGKPLEQHTETGLYIRKLIDIAPLGKDKPYYYWGRLDKEWDYHVTLNERRQVFSLFYYAPADLSLSGSYCSTARDYHLFQKAIYEIVSRLIDKYGVETCSSFYWDYGAEYDLIIFWRIFEVSLYIGEDLGYPFTMPKEHFYHFQKLYDYYTNAIYLAFEDYYLNKADENERLSGAALLAKLDKLMIGGLGSTTMYSNDEEEQAFGEYEYSTAHWYRAFLYHCSPFANAPDPNQYPIWEGVVEDNFVCLDNEAEKAKYIKDKFCHEEGDIFQNQGAPLKYVNLHLYNTAELASTKLTRAKEKALDIDPSYYADLWVNSFATGPDWALTRPYPAIAEIFTGNGYIPSWFADYTYRLLNKANEESNYSSGQFLYGTDVIPNINFGITSYETFSKYKNVLGSWMRDFYATPALFKKIYNISGDQNLYDTANVYKATIPTPDFHFLALMSSMGDVKTDAQYQSWLENNQTTIFWLPTPESQSGTIEGYEVSGFASRDDNENRQEIQVLLYAHNPLDLQSRDKISFEISLDIGGVDWLTENDTVCIAEYSFDSNDNTVVNWAKTNFDKVTFTDEEIDYIKDKAKLDATNHKSRLVSMDDSIHLDTTVDGNGVVFLLIKKCENAFPEITVGPTKIHEGVSELISRDPVKPTYINKDVDTIILKFLDENESCDASAPFEFGWKYLDYKNVGMWTSIDSVLCYKWMWPDSTTLPDGSLELQFHITDDNNQTTQRDGYYVCVGGNDSLDSDSDGISDTCDLCPEDPGKSAPGICGCGIAESECGAIQDDPPEIGDGPFLMAYNWPVLPTSPDSPMSLDQNYGVLWTFSDDFASCSEDCTHTAEYSVAGSDSWTSLAVSSDAAAGSAWVALPITGLQNATTYAFRFAVTDCASQSTKSLNYYFRVDRVDGDGDGYTIDVDCDDADASVYQLLSGYLDSDSDGIGSGSAVQVCSGESLPAGYSDSSTDNCPNTPNGPLAGTCYNFYTGAGDPCTSHEDCQDDPPVWYMWCDTFQNDLDADGIGDVCE